MPKKVMKKINESFSCVHCGKQNPEAPRTSRNHCPRCFCSLHVDGDVPGDRSASESCGAKMFPIEYKILNSEYKILFQCSKCGKTHRNKRAIDDEITELPRLIEEYREILY